MKNNPNFYLLIKTSNMGSCQCGDCYCKVFADGTIQYEGSEKWQQSERRAFAGNEEQNRPYSSMLTVLDYNKAMATHNA